MTRPKGDSDPWLTDPISRDRVIAKTVVEGMHTIISLLRGIREDLGETRALRDENRQMRAEIHDLWIALNGVGASAPRKRADYNECMSAGCSLPDGHLGNHRGSIRAS